MPSNVEIKARVANARQFAERAEQLSGGPPQRLQQHDSFYAAARGRLKLRRFADGNAELIFYQRSDADGPKVSDYARLSVADPSAMHALLDAALGCTGTVKKNRRVWLVGRTRVHLDEVEGLGTYMELEVVMRDGEPATDGEAEARALMSDLGVEESSLVAGAYVDLLARG
ncbi:MAG: class IV adenylate cyclase [Pseudomonadota bacterium]